MRQVSYLFGIAQFSSMNSIIRVFRNIWNISEINHNLKNERVAIFICRFKHDCLIY